tara:strand:+ start:64607 stop:64930 length:324 start_codon:yes stop_codon:yes gene_type:complete
MAKLGQLSDAQLQLADIHRLPPNCSLEQTNNLASTDAPPSRDALLKTLHLRTADGRWLTGIDANVAAWQHTRLGPLWRWLSWPLIRPVADRVYRLWAERRYRRLYSS